MRLLIEADVAAVAQRTAEYIAERIRDYAPTADRPFVLGLPAEQTPIHTYRELVSLHKRGKLSFRNVITFNLYEYCGLPRDHQCSSHDFMWRNFFSHIDILRENVHIPNGLAIDLLEECVKYEQKIERVGGIELFLSGIGFDGRIAGNEPGSSLRSRTRVKTLSRETILTQAPLFGSDLSKVPKRALTMGVQTIMQSREVLFVLSGLDSADALKAAIEDDMGHLCTASAVQRHPCSLLIVDEDATSSLKVKTVQYFKGLTVQWRRMLDGQDPMAEQNPAKRRALDPVRGIWLPGPGQPTRSVSPAKGDRDSLSGGSGTMKLTNVKVVRNGKLIEEDLWIRNGKILDGAREFWSSSSYKEFHADVVRNGRGAVVVPGFVELQLNGAFGVDFTDPQLKQEDVIRVAHGILAHGVTSFLPTVITAKPELYQKVLPMLRPGCTNGRGAEILGVHCEGPFIAWQKKGTHPEECVQKAGFPDGIESARRVYGAENLSNGTIRMVTLAPELDGALETVSTLARSGVTVSIGHTTAGIETSEAAVQAGARKITHLFNAMAPFHHRDPGPVGLLGFADSTLQRAHYGIIADGLHVHPSAVNMAFSSNRERCVLVTDSMAALGLDEGAHSIGGVDVVVEKAPAWGRGKVLRARKAGTETLAGAVVDMHTCFKNLIAFTGCDVVAAAECASTHAATAIDCDRKGRLDPGCDADFLLLDPETLELQQTWVGGCLMWQASGSQSSEGFAADCK